MRVCVYVRFLRFNPFVFRYVDTSYIHHNRALATIVLAVEPKLFYLLRDPVDPTIVRKKLQDTFQKKSWANKLRSK